MPGTRVPPLKGTIKVEEIEVCTPNDLANKLDNPPPGFVLHSWNFIPAYGNATRWSIWIVWVSGLFGRAETKFKQMVIGRMANGCTVTHLAKELGMNRRTLYYWKKQDEKRKLKAGR